MRSPDAFPCFSFDPVSVTRRTTATATTAATPERIQTILLLGGGAAIVSSLGSRDDVERSPVFRPVDGDGRVC
ncbi:MAG: hypothetical protein A2Z34_05780 [Planctomycetes bacterium RBG_16_59_8]|nr:MAG: hypothetical protein A2Z34_05780 [Planctomycetes bacterium RBG_16_59_8]